MRFLLAFVAAMLRHLVGGRTSIVAGRGATRPAARPRLPVGPAGAWERARGTAAHTGDALNFRNFQPV